MITLTHASPIDEKSENSGSRRKVAESEFARTVHEINQQAKKIGLEANYSESWEELMTNDYEGEDENLLEPEGSQAAPEVKD